MKNKKKNDEKQINKFPLTLLLVIITIIVIISLFLIILVRKNNSKNNKNEYEILAKSSYNAMKKYLIAHPYDRSISLEKLENENYLSSRKNPKAKENDCTGRVEVEISNDSQEKIKYGDYTIYLCCDNHNKKYTYPKEKEEKLIDKSKCNTTDTEQELDSNTITCQKGEYLKQGQTMCEPCLNSYYCPGGNFNLNAKKDQGLIPCPTGYKNSEIGSYKEKQCFVTVPANHYIKNKKNKVPTPCETGQLRDAHNVYYGDISSCTPKKIEVIFDCNSGTGGGRQTFISGTPEQKFNKKCTKSGKTQDGWKKDKNSKSRDYTMNNNITDSWIITNYPKITLYAHWKDLSINCPSGTYIKRNETTCSKCLENKYCPGGTYTLNTSNDQGIKSCPEGYNNSIEGSSKKEQCFMNVEKGKYIKVEKDANSTKCPSGTYNTGHKVYYGSISKCNDCPAGYSNSKEGSTKTTQCFMNVPDEEYVKNKKDSSGTKCPNGYESDTHKVYYNETSTCDIKSYQCELGEYLPKNQTTCTNCPSGSYCKGGKFKYSSTKDQGIKKCPSGYNKSKESSTKISDCFMNVSKNKYVKKAKDKTSTNCPKNTTLKAHTVKYGKISSPCNCSTAPNVTLSSSKTGGFRCPIDQELQRQSVANYFNISGCTSGLNGFICYHNPKGSNCVGKELYSKNSHYDNGYGHIAFKKEKWAYFRSSEQAWAMICNENKCANIYKLY